MREQQSYTRELITPVIATRWLIQRPEWINRHLRVEWVQTLAKIIKSGNWNSDDPGPICLTSSGRLLNGQHRLHAIIQAGIGVEVLVGRGIPETALSTIDINKPRSPGDTLALNGYPVHANAVASAARIVGPYLDSYRLSNAAIKNFPTIMVVQVRADHPGLVDAVSYVAARAKIMGTASTLAAWYYLTGRVDPALREEFFKSLLTGENLTAGNPALTLRNRLIEMRGRMPNGQESKYLASAWFCRAWNAASERRPLTAIKFRPGVDDFPYLVQDHEQVRRMGLVQ